MLAYKFGKRAPRRSLLLSWTLREWWFCKSISPIKAVCILYNLFAFVYAVTGSKCGLGLTGYTAFLVLFGFLFLLLLLLLFLETRFLCSFGANSGTTHRDLPGSTSQVLA